MIVWGLLTRRSNTIQREHHAPLAFELNGSCALARPHISMSDHCIRSRWVGNACVSKSQDANGCKCLLWGRKTDFHIQQHTVWKPSQDFQELRILESQWFPQTEWRNRRHIQGLGRATQMISLLLTIDSSTQPGWSCAVKFVVLIDSKEKPSQPEVTAGASQAPHILNSRAGNHQNQNHLWGVRQSCLEFCLQSKHATMGKCSEEEVGGPTRASLVGPK